MLIRGREWKWKVALFAWRAGGTAHGGHVGLSVASELRLLLGILFGARNVKGWRGTSIISWHVSHAHAVSALLLRCRSNSQRTTVCVCVRACVLGLQQEWQTCSLSHHCANMHFICIRCVSTAGADLPRRGFNKNTIMFVTHTHTLSRHFEPDKTRLKWFWNMFILFQPSALNSLNRSSLNVRRGKKKYNILTSCNQAGGLF